MHAVLYTTNLLFKYFYNMRDLLSWPKLFPVNAALNCGSYSPPHSWHLAPFQAACNYFIKENFYRGPLKNVRLQCIQEERLTDMQAGRQAIR